MPSVGQFLELFEALARRDFEAILEVARGVAKRERELKHYSAAHQILEAVEAAISRSDLDQVGTLSAPFEPLKDAPPEILYLDRSDTNYDELSLADSVQQEIDSFLSEWSQEKRLLENGLIPRKSVLLVGPPGCGKTLIARYVARSLGMPLFLLRFDALISSYLGATSGNIRSVFEFAGNNRCAIFFDEIDAIAKLRDDKNDLGELKRVVISLLQNFDLLTGRGIVIGATNHPHMLDPALWRRFELVLEVNFPPPSARLRIIEKNFSQKLPADLNDIIIRATEGMSGADIASIAQNAKRQLVLCPDVERGESLLRGLVNHIRRTATSSGIEKRQDQLLFEIAAALRKRDKGKYSYLELEILTGVPHSTLHHNIAKGERSSV